LLQRMQIISVVDVDVEVLADHDLASVSSNSFEQAGELLVELLYDSLTAWSVDGDADR
jgi:hypothetical protein